MKNFEKNIDEGIIYQCRVHTLRTKNKDCDGGNGCEECARLNEQWLLEEYVEPILLSHDEYVILKNLNSYWKWIVRDEDATLQLFESKPIKNNAYNSWSWGTNSDNLNFYRHLFHFIQWEDEEPYEISKLIEDYERENVDE